MILRLVQGRLLPGRLEPFRSSVGTALGERLRETPGIVRAHVGIRHTSDGDEAAFLTAWPSPDEAIDVLGPELGPGKELPGVSEHLAIDQIDHYEVDESRIPHGSVSPSVLRIAAGWIELGADVEIQQELRSRLGDLGRDIEAYVGRRIRDRSVEVALVTLWPRQLEDRALERPLFPDIAARYAALVVKVFDVVPIREPG
ncbi:MAG TPA: hypothetical protein VLA44_01510 [Clostridia bacterium]|nr:hypothetical protein [Clostridia bacterium]